MDGLVIEGEHGGNGACLKECEEGGFLEGMLFENITLGIEVLKDYDALVVT